VAAVTAKRFLRQCKSGSYLLNTASSVWSVMSVLSVLSVACVIRGLEPDPDHA